MTAAGALRAAQETRANDRIRIATIGFGGMGMGDTKYALTIPGVELVAVCDIYDGRLTRAREVHGDGVFTTRDYREILARKDVDAVIIATPDHWHADLAIAAMEAGKHVYCEKPMVQRIEDGKRVIAAQDKTGKVFQVGSQYVTSAVYQKARDLFQAGAIGRLTMVEAWLDRNTALGAWQYSIPPDATPSNIDWDRFLGKAPKRAFEPIRLFRWRNYRDYGTGVGGDLFVHLLSGLHVVTGSAGPERIFATGGLRFWEDGRDVPDVLLAMFDYGTQATHGDFTFSLRVNLKSGVPEERFGFRFMGTDGVITTSMSSLTMEKPAPETAPGHSIGTFAKATQEKFLEEYRAKYPDGAKPAAKPEPEKFAPPAGYDAHREHHRAFYEAIRAKKKPVEDAVFGFRAAGPALLANTSYFEKRIVLWDPVAMTVKKS